MKIVAIIQARMGSSRLPGTGLIDLAGQPVIARLINRLSKSKKIDGIWLATTTNPEDDSLIEWAKRNNINFYRGQVKDVLDRYYQAASLSNATVIVRITGDCPLIDPEIVDKVIEEFLNTNSDYVSNIKPPTFPDGLDVEVFSRAALNRAWQEAKLDSEREHVTPYLWKNANLFKLKNIANTPDLSHLRWTLDMKEDWDFLNRVFTALEQSEHLSAMSNLKDILALIGKHPDWLALNSQYQRNEGYLKSVNEDRKISRPTALTLLKYELDKRLYYYGQHFSHPQESNYGRHQSIRAAIKALLKNIYLFYLILKNKKSSGRTIVSNAYFSVNQEIQKLGFKVLRPLHNLALGAPVTGDIKILKKFIKINKKIKNGNFNELSVPAFLKEIDQFIDDGFEYYRAQNLAGLIVPNDLSFWEQANLAIFKELKKPSFIFLHGLPGVYSLHNDNLSDYLVVWGQKIKDNFIKIGFKPEKILIAGHPYYQKLPSQPMRNSLDNILVLSKAPNGAPFRNNELFSNRGDQINYLNQIANTLKLLGVRQVRLRIHPSENINWYLKFIDKDFFIPDRAPLVDSLRQATLVIGPTSTVFLEALYYGVNYLAYEPLDNGLDLSGYTPVPPFDGSDLRVPVARDEESLKQLIQNKALVDISVFNDYIETPFNPEVITKLI